MDGENNRRVGGGDWHGPKKPYRVRRVMIIGVILVICASAVYYFVPAVRNIFPSMDNGKGKGAEAAHAVKYTCPMHPFIVSDRPAACGICGMSLVPQEKASPKGGASKAEAHVPGGVSMSPTQRVMANVATTRVEYREFSTNTSAVGKVSWDERRLSRISARVSGRVERLHVDYTGARVKRGQPLLDIYSPDLVAAQKEYLLAIEGADRDKDNPMADSRSMMEGLREAARSRLKLWGMTEAQIGALARTRRPKLVVTIFSPVAGVVTERLISAGQYVNEGAQLFSVAPLSSVWVEAELYETEIGRAKIGASAAVTTDAYPGKTFRGKVSFIDSVVNPEARTIKVRVDLYNPDGLLKPEMFVKVALDGSKVRALAVPEGAVVITGDRALAWIELSPGVFEPRDIRVGRRGEGFYEVFSGLSGGETVAASGGFLIDSESQLKTAQSGAAEDRGGTAR